MFGKEMTYKQLCKELGEEEKSGGRNKKLHLEKLMEQYDIDKVRRGKYVINKKYTEEEIELISAEKNYDNFVQAALLDLISQGDISQVYTYSDFRKQLYMVNSNYFLYRYKKEKLNIQAVKDFPGLLIEEIEDRWFNIAEAHDKYVLRSNLNKLREKGIIDYYERYSLRKAYRLENGNIYEKSKLSTDEEWSKIEQAKMDFMVEIGVHSIQELYKIGPEAVARYYNTVDEEVEALGYDNYSKAFVIFRPYELKRNLHFLSPKFNHYQVDRLLKSKRFGMIPSSIHKQMIDKTIKL